MRASYVQGAQAWCTHNESQNMVPALIDVRLLEVAGFLSCAPYLAQVIHSIFCVSNEWSLQAFVIGKAWKYLQRKKAK